MKCPVCNHINDEAARECVRCGCLFQSVRMNPVCDREEIYKAIIGPKNQGYYLSRFRKFDAEGKPGLSWHWPALFITFYWLLYRKMWLFALLYWFSPYLLGATVGILMVLFGSGSALAGVMSMLAAILYLLLPALYANAAYYQHCQSKIREVQGSDKSFDRQLGELSARGGTSVVVMIIILTFMLIGSMGILAAIAIPAYQDYTVRARMVSALNYGGVASHAVSAYYAQHHSMPDDLENAGFSDVPPNTVRQVYLNQAGTLEITLAFVPMQNHVLHLRSFVGPDGTLLWSCTGQDIPHKYLPRTCRDDH